MEFKTFFFMNHDIIKLKEKNASDQRRIDKRKPWKKNKGSPTLTEEKWYGFNVQSSQIPSIDDSDARFYIHAFIQYPSSSPSGLYKIWRVIVVNPFWQERFIKLQAFPKIKSQCNIRQNDEFQAWGNKWKRVAICLKVVDSSG